MVRKAVLDDVKHIQEIIDSFANMGVMLPRTIEEITKSLRDFFVFELDGAIVGIGALNVSWKGMGEVRSLAVRAEFVRQGIGSAIVNACVDEATELGLKRVFALTYKTEFFQKLGFKVVDKKVLPQKIWGDCVRCAKFPLCDETAVLLDLD